MMKTTKKCTAMLLLLLCIPSAYAGDGIENIGNAGQIVLPAVAVLSIIHHRDKEGAFQFAKAFTAAIVTTYTLKFSTNRRRPNGGHYSFPSGHTTSAFTGAAFMQRRYGWYYGAPAYAAATFVGWSRVHSDMHYPTDVIAGAVIGIGANMFFTTRFHHNVTVTPCISKDMVGASANITFNE